MRILMLGVSHRTAPVELRERLALTGNVLADAVEAFREGFPRSELVVLSACNRTELYLARPSHEQPSVERLRGFLAEQTGVDADQLIAATSYREAEEAVRHLFRVASGLDSMVIGEPQVLGQVKRAYEQSVEFGAVGPVLHHLCQQAIATAKQVRTCTGIADGRLSVGSVAVSFAGRIFDRFDDKTVLGIGAGEMAKTVLQHLSSLGPRRLWLTSRTLGRAEQLAEDLQRRGGRVEVRPIDELDRLLAEADVVLTATGSPTAILDPRQFRRIMRRRRNRPIFLVDIAVPRDIDPAVGELSNVYLYNIDDLQQVVQETMAQRQAEAHACERLVDEAVERTMAEARHHEVGPIIRALRRQLHEAGEAERERTMRKLAAAEPDEYERIVQEHTHRVVNKILHIPLSRMDIKRHPDAPLGFYGAALRRLFGLEETTGPQTSTPESGTAPSDTSPRGEPEPARSPGSDDQP